jgi:hypothetical protein
MRSVNADLEKVRRSLVEKARKCAEGANGTSDWEDSARVDLLTRGVFSIYIGISYYCGGPHPDDEYMPLTYNMKTGKRFDFEKDAAQLFLNDSIPTGQLMDLYRRYYGKPAGGCEISDLKEVEHIFLHFASEGLVINPDIPHVVAACGPEIVIPWGEVKPLVKPDNPFASLFDSLPGR